MLCGWEGNRRSDVALAMRHGHSDLSTYGFNGHRMGDKHSAYAFGGVWQFYLSTRRTCETHVP